MKLGLISDTHNYFDPQIPQLFEGADRILHAGDIGSAFITFQLEQIAPVTAVLGNNDSMLPFRETEVLDLGERRFLIHHIVNPRALDETLRRRIARERPHVVLFGHTHKPFCQFIHDVLYINPGYAGKGRFGMERSVALLEWKDHDFRPKFIPLEAT